MDPRQISLVAKLLRDNGDKVLSSEYKITLTGSLLRALNDSFTLITDPNETCTPNTFQVLKPNNAKSEVFRELQIIYDFVQKAQILCLVAIPADDPFDGEIDIKKFRNLKRLEIQRIPIEQVIGIQRLRAYLQELICSKSIQSIQSIIAHCGGDNANLQQLNLSHNQIVSVDAIKWLPNLKKLNLSYNNLSQIPQSIASRRLQSLILANNFIENLTGLPKLEALSELNLANNCILDHAALEPLGSLIALQDLQLHGNPIACHPNHREETCKYLHKNVASVKFFLDCKPLNKYEKNLIGYFQSFNNWSRNRRASKLKRSSGFSTPRSRQTTDVTPASSIGSFRSFQMEGSTSSTMDLSATNELGTSHISTSSQKRIKVRPALIADDDNDEGKKTEVEPATPEIDEMGNREHLKTMKQIEDLRKEYGDGWLQCQSASKVQNVMGIQAIAKKTPLTTTEQKLESMFNLESGVNINREQASTPIHQIRHGDFAHSSTEQFQSPVSSSTDFQSAQNSDQSSKTLESAENTTLEETMFKSILSDDDPLKNLYHTEEPEPEQISDVEENETIYLAKNEVNQMDVILIVSDQSIREKNALTVKTLNKWTINMLESCERISDDVVRIRFDTVKRDKRERTYQLEKGQGRRLDDSLRNILSERPLSELITIFRCANCALQFTQEKVPHKSDERDSPRTTETGSTAFTSIRTENFQLEKSNSHSSIALRTKAVAAHPSPNLLKINEISFHKSDPTKNSASSINESLSQSAYSQSSFDSNQSLIGSTTNCEHKNDLDSYFASRFGEPPESDVEVLSNPSISSIEVLERFSRQSIRKQSEDSRYLLQTQLYVQQHQFNKSNDGSDSQSPSLDLLIKSTSNSDITSYDYTN